MNWEVLYHPDIVKCDLPEIPKNIQARLKKAIELRLLIDPTLSGGPLRKDLKGYRKMRVGDYRIIYRIEKNGIIILIIGHRKKVYSRVFQRI
jgi:mRNA interferase RelE/StbE